MQAPKGGPKTTPKKTSNGGPKKAQKGGSSGPKKTPNSFAESTSVMLIFFFTILLIAVGSALDLAHGVSHVKRHGFGSAIVTSSVNHYGDLWCKLILECNSATFFGSLIDQWFMGLAM
ncbi:hypothetical protein RHMOL_Rhmol11G0224000 [Rhododendron molle]|uniref:Uncharacterized protein n=1 Tax=Rhododendron molle TaxID=49168 RepID=A0ACC0LVC5_RHOML|nr:hypothetical protein RHMOL_Rhmol11G0224000 [Rhododendron molle]